MSAGTCAECGAELRSSSSPYCSIGCSIAARHVELEPWQEPLVERLVATHRDGSREFVLDAPAPRIMHGPAKVYIGAGVVDEPDTWHELGYTSEGVSIDLARDDRDVAVPYRRSTFGTIELVLKADTRAFARTMERFRRLVLGLPSVEQEAKARVRAMQAHARRRGRRKGRS